MENTNDRSHHQTFRAACYIANDRQSSVLLTLEEDAHRSDADLLSMGRKEFAEQGGTLDKGEIVIDMWTEAWSGPHDAAGFPVL